MRQPDMLRMKIKKDAAMHAVKELLQDEDSMAYFSLETRDTLVKTYMRLGGKITVE